MTLPQRRIPEAPTDAPAVVIAQLARALSHMGLLDARGRISVRSGDSIFCTPRPGSAAPPPGMLGPEDIVELDLHGQVRAGRWAPAVESAIDAALYRRRPWAGAVVHAQPRTVLAFSAARSDLLPVTHTESALVHRTIPRIGPDEPVQTSADADRLARALGDHRLAVLAGDGSLAIGDGPAEAAMLTQQIELLARSSSLASQFAAPDAPRLVGAADAARIFAQKAPADDFLGYFADVAAHRPPATTPPDAGDNSEAGVRHRVVVACRLLQHAGLIEHLEHVSVRIGDGSSFLITPRGNLGRLTTEQLATVDMEGRWTAGPLEPPPFLHFHRDVFLARPDVRAIVHTHQPLARAMAVAGVELRPLHRSGAADLLQAVRVYDEPDLMFDEDRRAAAVRLLDGATVLHERSHGVDFLSDTVEAATVHALHYEDHARVHLAARRIGTPAPYPRRLARVAQLVDPTPLDWWHHHLAELPALELI